MILILQNITINETVNFTISDKNTSLYEIKKELTIAREDGYIFNHINKFKIKISRNLSKIKNTLLYKTSYSIIAQTVF